MRPIFCGNLESDSRQNDLERLFRRYGEVERVDLKSGLLLSTWRMSEMLSMQLEDLTGPYLVERGADFEWNGLNKNVGEVLEIQDLKPTLDHQKPCLSLILIQFIPGRDFERHFDQYGKILTVRIRRNFAFVQFESQDDATKALDGMNMSKLMDRVISVKYAVCDDDD